MLLIHSCQYFINNTLVNKGLPHRELDVLRCATGNAINWKLTALTHSKARRRYGRIFGFKRRHLANPADAKEVASVRHRADRLIGQADRVSSIAACTPEMARLRSSAEQTLQRVHT